MTLGKKIKELREANSMLQKELATHLCVGDTFLSKIENDQRLLKREHLIKLSLLFNYPLLELEKLWLASKINDLIKNEEAGISALKYVENQTAEQEI